MNNNEPDEMGKRSERTVSMYTYEGRGYVIPADVMGDVDELVAFVREATGDGALRSVEDIDDMGLLGDYCSPDICDEARVDGEEVAREAGVFVIREEYEDDVRLADELLDACEFADEHERYWGEFFVECNQ